MNRRPGFRTYALVAGLCVVSLLVPTTVRGVADPSPTPATLSAATVDPALCQIEPLPLEPTLDTIEAIYRDGATLVESPQVLTVDASEWSTVTIDGEPWVLDGRLVDGAIIEPSIEPLLPSVERLLIEDAACGNAGDFARFFALRTSEEFARFMGSFDEEQISLDEWRTYFSAPTGSIGEGYLRVEPTLVAAKVISDGRLAIYGVFTSTASEVEGRDGPSLAEPQVWILEQVGDRWLIDWQIEFLQEIPFQLRKQATPTASTPGAEATPGAGL